MTAPSVAALERLHPALVHHVVNTLGWSSLRPLQAQAIEPVMDDEDCLLLAPTAGGKTEAAVFPVLSRMAGEDWRGLSVIYVCPLRALLNNLHPRVESYAAWVGRRAGLWHGDVGASRRRSMLADLPDVLLTTPESLESMLVSTSVPARDVFGDVRAVVVDEVHAFAGDDRGWHMLAVLERIARLSGTSPQRIGLSATVGNPDELLEWLQGPSGAVRRGRVVGVSASAVLPPPGDVGLDHVGTLTGAATVIERRHPGRKRLVFCESRATVEKLTLALRGAGVTTFASHSSLSRDERHQAEQAFAESRDCVIVSTSTLELGIDVGDLDHVLQVDAPWTVASFLQRLGRTGRRADTMRNATFLATEPDDLLQSAALLLLWGEGYVEPVQPPPNPAHIAVQQLMALCLQEGRVGASTWPEWLGGLPLVEDPAALTEHALAMGLVDVDGGMLHVGPEAERRYGRRHFLELMAVFTAAPEFTVVAGTRDVGTIAAEVLTVAMPAGQPRRITLGGQAWIVTHVDWKRRRCFVEPSDAPGKAKWSGSGARVESAALAGAKRRVLLGEDPPVTVSKRARAGLAELRENRSSQVSARGLVVERSGDDVWWWTFAGTRANGTLRANLAQVVEPSQAPSAERIRLRADVDPEQLTHAVAAVDLTDMSDPEPDRKSLAGLKFAEVLPEPLARQTVAGRLVDHEGARVTLTHRRLWR
ncbi:MAG: DEAD/DEAH box helicase [Kineosporiaceae bacterium]